MARNDDRFPRGVRQTGPVLAIPSVLARNVVVAWGADGQRWLDRLPTLIADVARDWDLELGRPYDLSFNWVVPARCSDGVEAVLKLGPPEPGHLAAEATALAAYGGHGAVRLLAHDHARGALLLERAAPGTMARSVVPERDPDSPPVLDAAQPVAQAAPATTNQPPGTN